MMDYFHESLSTGSGRVLNVEKSLVLDEGVVFHLGDLYTHLSATESRRLRDLLNEHVADETEPPSRSYRGASGDVYELKPNGKYCPVGEGCSPECLYGDPLGDIDEDDGPLTLVTKDEPSFVTGAPRRFHRIGTEPPAHVTRVRDIKDDSGAPDLVRVGSEWGWAPKGSTPPLSVCASWHNCSRDSDAEYLVEVID